MSHGEVSCDSLLRSFPWHSLRSLSCPLSQHQTDYSVVSWTLDRDTAPTAPAQRIRPAASGGGAASGSDLEACLPLLNCRLGKVQREHEQCLAGLCRFRSFSGGVLFLNYYNLSLHKRDSYVKLIKCLV
jgi:hypothetical protein